MNGTGVRRWLDDALGPVFVIGGTVGATFFLHGLGAPDELAIGLPLLVVGTIGWISWAVRRTDRRRATPSELTSGEVDALRVRMDDLDIVTVRMAQFEERAR